MRPPMLVVQGDARRIPLRDASVDLVVTSPPFYGQRDYRAGPGEIGSEAHWRDWLDTLLVCTAEMVRVLKPEGSIWVNLGDKYCNYQGPHYGQGRSLDGPRGPQKVPEGGPTDAPKRWGIPNKSLMLLPERYAIACVDQLGLILRRDQIWHKSNPIPESAGDRAHTTHDYWFHLVRQPRYYSALDELREPHKGTANWSRTHPLSPGGIDTIEGRNYHMGENPLGKAPGSVWHIPTERLPKLDHLDTKHYAAFGVEWPRRLILGWSPPGICLACGQGRFPVVGTADDPQGRTTNGPQSMARRHIPGGSAGFPVRVVTSATIIGYACACTPYTDHPERRRPTVTPPGQVLTQDGDLREALGLRRTHIDGWPERQPVREYHLDQDPGHPTRPAVVLDSFSGTGTTIHVAAALGRIGIGVDLSMDYCRLAADPALATTRAAKVHARTNADRQLVLVSPDTEAVP